jgi:threonine dehydrogenase-like Zn-dependent dehydrogenase
VKAAFFQDSKVHVGEMPEPVPGKGQALVRTHSCGLCASDVHFLHAGQNIIDLSRRLGGPYAALDFARPFVPGHEFVGEVIDYGPGSRRAVAPGRKVTSVPIMRQDGAHKVIGYSHECPGGFGELMLLDEEIMIEVPGGLDDDHAAMVEPLAVGLEHARRGRPTKDDAALVLGCGAIGLGVIAGLKLMGIAPIVAADFHPGRRELAIAAGAHIAVDPREISPYAPLPDFGNRQVNLIYECVGQKGMLQRIIEAAPFDGRIVMGGYCMDEEALFVFAAQNKRLNVQFAGGEEPQDMELALRSIAEGKIDVTPWLGARVGLSGVEKTLAEMSGPSAPVRTVVDPRLL